MKQHLNRYSAAALAAAALAAMPAPARAQWGNVNPPTAGQIGTTTVGTNSLGQPGNRRRVGIVAYCADMSHNAGDTGLQANKRNIRDGGQKNALAASVSSGLGPWFLDGPFDNLGVFGAQNVADYLYYDDGIDRVRDVQVIDGDLVQPTATQLIRNFDIVIAYTDNKCGIPIPTAIADQAASALQGFIQAPGKGLILTGFAFSSSIGFGNAIFGSGLSPLRKGGPALDLRCGREGSDCKVGTCPATNRATGLACGISGDPPECLDTDGTVCTEYQPLPATADFACDHMLSAVRGPTASSWATALTPASVAPGATLCFNYDTSAGTRNPYLAINAARNIVALNAMPADAVDIQKFWYGCIFGDIVQWLSGDHNRCSTRACR